MSEAVTEVDDKVHMLPTNVLEACLASVVMPPRRCLIMGILNVTPDSFSDGGLHLSPDAALAAAQRMASEGADLLDLGAESTRPGSQPVPPDVQLARLEPVLLRLRSAGFSLPLTIDTTRASVARRCLELGASGINDVSAGLQDPDMLPTVAAAGAVYIAMHMQGIPQHMQDHPRYPHAGVVEEVCDFLLERLAAARSAGIPDSRLLADPGIGFGKTDKHNLQLLRHLRTLLDRLGVPVLAGTSRKGFLGRLTGRSDPEQRLWGTAASVAWAVAEGVSVIRVHDVAAMRDVTTVIRAIRDVPNPTPDP